MSNLTGILTGIFAPRETVKTGVGQWILGFAQVMLAGGIFVGLCLFFAARYVPGVDDAYITYRYSWNFFNGHGLVYNPGLQPVEGYSTLLYALIVAAGFFFVGHGEVYTWSLAVNTAFGLLTILAIYLHVRRRMGQWWAFTLAVLVGSCPAMAYWAWSGMETTMIVFFQVLIWLAVLRLMEGGGDDTKNIALLSLASAASCWGRVDGFILPLLAAGYLWLAGRRRAAYVAGIVTVACALSYLAWSYGYYGEAFRNTARVKVEGTLEQRLAGASQIMSKIFWIRSVWFPIVVLFGLFFISSWTAWKRIVNRLTDQGGVGLKERWTDIYTATAANPKLTGWRVALDRSIKTAIREAFLRDFVGWIKRFVWSWVKEPILPHFSGVLGVALLAYWFYVGGDIYAERFLLLLWPVSLFMVCLVAPHKYKGSWRSYLGVALIGILALQTSWAGYYKLNSGGKEDPLIILSRFLGEEYTGYSFAIVPAGKIPYFCDQSRVDDALGLNDFELAKKPAEHYMVVGHNHGDINHTINLKPDLVVVFDSIPQFSGVVSKDGKLEQLKIDLCFSYTTSGSVKDFEPYYEVRHIFDHFVDPPEISSVGADTDYTQLLLERKDPNLPVSLILVRKGLLSPIRVAEADRKM